MGRDQLTGLGDRSEFALDGKRGDVRWASLAIVDLDKLILINDRHGMAAGDAVIVQTVTRLQQGLPAGSAVHRLGGDELTILCLRDPAELAGHLERLNTMSDIDHARTSYSAGVSALSEDVPLDLALAQGDAALSHAKTHGGACVSTYADAVAEYMNGNQRLSDELRRLQEILARAEWLNRQS